MSDYGRTDMKPATGYRQTTIWLTVDDLDALDRLKVTLGAGNRSEVISALLKDRQS